MDYFMEEPILNAHNKEEYPPMHTAEHILNGTMVKIFGCPRSRNAHIERKKSKCDYILPCCPTDEQVAQLEAAVNEVIGRHLDVTIEFMPRKQAADICIGAHVKNTAEIGTFKILSHDYEDGRWRVRWKVQ